MKRIKIGIVGCGAIGSSLAEYVANNFLRQAQLAAIYDLDNFKSVILAQKVGKKSLAAKSLKALIKRSDLVIEAASAKSSFDIAAIALKAKKDIMVMSVGGIVRGFPVLYKLAVENNRKIYIPSGALSGIDALKAAKINRVQSVTLITTKNPSGFKGVEYLKGKGISLSGLKKEAVLFSGSAEDAVRYFPQNINVAAVLSLSGIGIRKTKVKIVASPKVNRNIHEVRIKSSAGNIFTRTENVLHPDNPKTSYLAVLSAAAVLKRILEPVIIGT